MILKQRNSKAADLVINRTVVETELYIYGKTGEDVAEKLEEQLILEVLASGGKVASDAPLWAAIGGSDVEQLPSASTCYNTLKVAFRQFIGSVSKVDYLTMRNGFINAHFAANTKFDFHKYIKRSMEDDFKVVVGIRMLQHTSVGICYHLLASKRLQMTNSHLVVFSPTD